VLRRILDCIINVGVKEAQVVVPLHQACENCDVTVQVFGSDRPGLRDAILADLGGALGVMRDVISANHQARAWQDTFFEAGRAVCIPNKTCEKVSCEQIMRMRFGESTVYRCS
jgi:hypothetical protein